MTDSTRIPLRLNIKDFQIDDLEGNGWTAPIVGWDHILETLVDFFGPMAGQKLYDECFEELTKGHDIHVGTLVNGPFPWALSDWLEEVPSLDMEDQRDDD